MLRELCRKYNITVRTFLRWRNQFIGMNVSEAQRLKKLEAENSQLKRMMAEQLLVIDGLRESSGKNEHPAMTAVLRQRRLSKPAACCYLDLSRNTARYELE